MPGVGKRAGCHLTSKKYYGIIRCVEKLQHIDGEEDSAQKGGLKKRTQFTQEIGDRISALSTVEWALRRAKPDPLSILSPGFYILNSER
jgi:hypothetical protein